jgi:hypothetical protein
VTPLSQGKDARVRPAKPGPSPTEVPNPTTPATKEPTAIRPALRPLTSRPGQETALAVLAGLPVKGRGAQTGYERDKFGQAWFDTNRNACDTRSDILARDLTTSG